MEVPAELIEETQRIVVAAMESTPACFTVPLKVESKDESVQCQQAVPAKHPRR